MSWMTAGRLVTGPPSASGSGPAADGPSLAQRFRPNLGGRTAFERERGAGYAARDGGGGGGGGGEGRTEWDVLRENHRFIREDEAPGEVSWEERLARAYESKLFKEFALIDLKHYKSKRLALRWRTAPEVVDGIGEDTCGGLRCAHHRPPRSVAFAATPRSEASLRPGDAVDAVDRRHDDDDDYGAGDDGGGGGDDDSWPPDARASEPPVLRSFELPFVYAEAGERREALVKVRLCARCTRKLLWKPGGSGGAGSGGRGQGAERARGEGREGRERRRGGREGGRQREGDGKGDAGDAGRDWERERETDRRRPSRSPGRARDSERERQRQARRAGVGREHGDDDDRAHGDGRGARRERREPHEGTRQRSVSPPSPRRR